MRKTQMVGLAMLSAAAMGFSTADAASYGGYLWSANDRWSFELTPYIWFAGIDADVTVRGRKADVDVGFDDLVDKVDLGGSFLAVAQKGQWVNWLQFDYFQLSDDETAERLGGAEVEVESDSLFVTVATGIQIDGWSEGQTFDLLGGVRYARLDNEITVSGIGSADKSTDVVDAVLVLRPSLPLGYGWRFNPTLSIGAGESDLTYELQPQFQYSFNETWAARIGYRRLFYDIDEGENKFDGVFHGFILGMGGRF